MLGRNGIHVAKQAREAVELLLHTAGTACGGDLGQPLVHLHNRRRLTVRGWRQALRGEAKVAGLAVQLDDLLLRSAVGHRDRGDEQQLAESDFDWLEERREPTLDQAGERLELVRRAGPAHLG